MKKYLILLFTVLTSLHVSAQSDGSQLWLGKQYANSCQVISQLPEDATAKIAKQESALRPWALSVNYPNGTARKLGEPGGYARLQKQPSSKDQALRWAKRLIEQGQTVSFGLMQISSQNLARLGYTLEQAYEPCTNIKIAGTLLSQKLASAKTLAPDNPLPVALSLYNSGDMRMGFANGYVSGVLGQVVKPDSLRVDSAGANVGKIALEAATPSPVRTEAAAPVKK